MSNKTIKYNRVFQYTALTSQLVNIFFPVLFYKINFTAYAQETPVEESTETVVEENTEEEKDSTSTESTNSSSEESSTEESTETSTDETTEDATTEESASDTSDSLLDESSDEQSTDETDNTSNDESSTETTDETTNDSATDVSTEETSEETEGTTEAQTELDVTTETTDETSTEPQTEVAVETETEGDILDTGAKDYQPEEESTEESTQPSTDLSVGVSIEDTSPFIELVVEELPTSNQENSEPETYTENGMTCLINEVFVDSSSDDWTELDSSTYETKNKVELGVRYVFPGNEDVTVAFSCLPENDEDVSNLRIEEIDFNDIDLPEGYVPAYDYAYDITTDMEDGTFKYEVTLPTYEDADAELAYVEKSADEVKTDGVNDEELEKVDSSDVEKDSTKIKGKNQDHFTVYVVIAPQTADPEISWPNMNTGYDNYLDADGHIVNDLEDDEFGTNDSSNGGTNVSPEEIDIASGAPYSGTNAGDHSSLQYYYDDNGTGSCTDDYLFLRMRLVGDPSAQQSSGSLYTSYHWDFLINTDGDSYPNYVVDIFGGKTNGAISGGDSGTVGIYPNDANATTYTPASNLWIARADVSENYHTRLNYEDYDDGDSSNDQYWLEAAIPLNESYSDLCGMDNLDGNLFASTSTSNTDPLQKDWMNPIGFFTEHEKSKAVENSTNPGATTQQNPAKAGDLLVYTLTTENTGTLDIPGYVVEDDIYDILQYATITDADYDGNGNTGAIAGGIITWDPQDIEIGDSAVEQFSVTVKPSQNWPGDGDFLLENVYGNSTEVYVEKFGTIIVVKDVVPNALTDFEFGGDLGTFYLDDDEGVQGADSTLSNSKTFDNLSAGTYGIYEMTATGYETEASCSNGSPISAVSVDADETVTCTFTNTRISIEVAKTANPTSVPETGGDVDFTVRVDNPNNVSVELTSLVDDKFGDLDTKGDCSVPQTISAGSYYECTFTEFLAGNTNESHTNTVTATADGVSAYDDATVRFNDVAPTIEVTKTANPTVVPETGGDVSFTFEVTNTGSEDVTLNSLVDTVFGDLNGQGNCSLPQTLLVGETYSCVVTKFLSSDNLQDHYNVTTAYATDDDGTQTSDDDDETVTFLNVVPEIRLTKTANPTEVPETGGNVTFTFQIDNIGAEDVALTSLTDDVFGDLNGEGTCTLQQFIPIGGSYSCSIVRFLASDNLDPHTNTATAVVVDDDGSEASDEDDATVTFSDVPPAIKITKTASPTTLPESGGDVTFTFLVENIGEEDVTLNYLDDTVFGDLNGQGDCSIPQFIAIGGSYSCAITTFLSGDNLDDHYNVVTAKALDDDGHQTQDSDDETVTFRDEIPTIEVTKTPGVNSVDEPGDDVTFTFTVKNTDDFEDVTITSLVDSEFGVLSGDSDCQVGTVLSPDETCDFSETFYVSAPVGTSHENTFTARATDNDGNEVSDDATATVRIAYVPTLKLVKYVDNNYGGVAGPADWDLTASGDGNGFTDDGNSVTFHEVTPGVKYTLSEAPDAGADPLVSTGYESLGWSCNGGDRDGDTIVLAAEDDVTCTITNRDIQPKLVVEKFVEGGDAQPSDFWINVYGSEPQPDRFRGSESGEEVYLRAGEYEVVEDQNDWYTPEYSADCDGTIAIGEVKTCTITNVRNTGLLTVHKRVDTDGDGIFETTNDDANTLGFRWLLDSDLTENNMGSTLNNVPTDNYDVTEKAVNNYHFVGWEYGNTECREFENDYKSDGQLPVNIDITKGEETVITLCNAVNTGYVEVVKDIYPDSQDREWNFDLSGPTSDTYVLGDGESSGMQTVVAGGYSIIESPVSGTNYGDDYNTRYECEYTDVSGYVTFFAGEGTQVDHDINRGEYLYCEFFNEIKLGNIEGYKYEDVNGDSPAGTADDLPLKGWKIFIDKDADGVWDANESYYNTDSNGGYSFNDLLPDTYRVCEVVQNGWTAIYPITACHNVTVNPGETSSDVNFYNFELATIYGYKYNDLDADGDSSDNDEPLNGWEINLTGQNSVTTGNGAWSDGYYEFTGLVPNAYNISETGQAGWTQSYGPNNPIVVKSGDEIRVDFGNWTQGEIVVCKYDDIRNPILGWEMTATGGDLNDPLVQATGENGCTVFELNPGTYSVSEETRTNWTPQGPTTINDVVIESNHKAETIKFFNARPADLQILKFNDLNGDKQNDQEPYMSGWYFEVYEGTCDNKGSKVAEGSTSTDNPLSFELPTGDYCVVENGQSGWINTAPGSYEYDVTLIPAADEVIEFGNYAYGQITACKYEDVNGNGTKDAEDFPLSNISMILYKKLGVDWFVQDTKATGEEGCYTFEELEAGEYRVEEDYNDPDLAGYYSTNGVVYQDFTIISGSVETAEFLNSPYRTISGYKFEDLNGNGDWDQGEPGLPGWTIYLDLNSNGQMDLSEPYAVTDSNGYYEFDESYQLVSDQYRVREVEQYPWTQTAPAAGYHDVDLHVLYSALDINFGNVIYSDVHGYKWEDLNGNGRRDEGEPLLSGWRIFIDRDKDGEWDEGEEESMVTSSDENHFGWYWFKNVLPGEYRVCEVQQNYWEQTFPVEPECHTVYLPDYGECEFRSDFLPTTFSTAQYTQNAVLACEHNFGNKRIIPELFITKKNNREGDDLYVGDTIKYTITVEVTTAPAYDVKVVDLLPDGIKYISGSWKVTSKDNGNVSTSEPNYSSPGTWELGNIDEGDTYTLTYRARVQSSANPGVYKDIAYAYADGTDTFAQAENPGYINDTFVGTQVVVVEDPDDPDLKVDVDTIEEGEVLGLPSTGSPTAILIASIIGFVVGSVLIGISLMKNRKSQRIMSMLLAAGIFAATLGAKNVHAASSLQVQIEEPEYLQTDSFNISFVALDIEDRNLVAECQKWGPKDSGWVQFGADIDLGAGGDSSVCKVKDSHLSKDGDYDFRVKVTPDGNSGDAVFSDTVTVLFDGEGPDEPEYLRKEKDGSCQFELKFRTADDDETEYVIIYRGGDQNFTADDGAKVKKMSVDPDKEYTYEDDLYGNECGKTYYYGIRAFDDNDRGSDVVSEDDEVIIVELEPEYEEEPVVITDGSSSVGSVDTSDSAAGQVAGTTDTNSNGIPDLQEDLNDNGIVDGEEDLNGNGIPDGKEVDDEGTVLGEEDEDEMEVRATPSIRELAMQYWWVIVIVLGIIVAVLSKKGDKDNGSRI